MMLDHDGGPGPDLDPETLHQQLIEACPLLVDAPMLWRPSASYGILSPDGTLLTSYGKHRFYLAVADAQLIPDAGKKIFDLLWAHGYGWCVVSRAGTALERTLFDGAVWQPERLDFAAEPELQNGLTRAAVGHKLFGDQDQLFDLKLIQIDGSVTSAAKNRRKAARASVKEQCEAQRDIWVTANAPALAAERNITEEQARAVLSRASERRVLMGNFMLTAQDGERVSVGEVLDNVDKWHNKKFADPLGDYPNDRRIATANLKSGMRPVMWCYGHGGQTFELSRQSARVQVGDGHTIEATDATISVLRDRGDLFDFGESAIAYVADGRARPVTRDWLLDHMGRAVDYFVAKPVVDEEGKTVRFEERPRDPPSRIASAIMARNGQRNFRTLTSVVNAPTLRGDGSLLDTPGYDEASGTLYFSQEEPPYRIQDPVPPEFAVKALRHLWQPFANFPFVDDIARGVFLQSLITACLRGSLPSAPGTAFDAPAAGTGKTLLARCIGALATGEDPPLLPPADTDEETRKRLFAALRDGSRVLIWDNVREPLGCASLDTFLTAPTFRDRILGESAMATLPNRAMFVVTGNNLHITGDTCRRILVSRLDAQMERVYMREFDFNPVDRIKADRMKYVIDVLIIVRAWITAGRPRVERGRTASFEEWDDLVRQPLCWLRDVIRSMPSTEGVPSFDDPTLSTASAFEQDPQTAKHAALLRAWYDTHANTPTTIAAALQHTTTTSIALRDAIDDIAPIPLCKSQSRVLGHWLSRHVGQVIGGLRFVSVGKARENVVRWAVEKVVEK